jgi:hypothetical protein
MYMSGKQNNQRSFKVIDLTPDIKHVNILVTVVSKTTRHKVIATKKNRDIHWVAEAHVGDETASIFLRARVRGRINEKTMSLQPIDLVPSIAIYNISTFIGLKVPRRDDDDIVHAYPDPSLHLPSDSR